jgi:hypothetical protein
VDVYASLQRAATGQVGSANGGLILPSLGWLAATSFVPLNLVVLANAYWDADNWNNAYWDNAYWDNAYWDNAYWDNAYWDNAYWDSSPNND